MTQAQVFKWSEMPTETLWQGNLTRTAIRSDGGVVAINWHKPGQHRQSPHSHPFDQLVLIVAGTFAMQVGDEVVTLPPGSAMRIPANVPHTGWNAGDDVVVNIDFFAPIREDYLFLAVNQAEYGEVPESQARGFVPTISTAEK